MDTLRITIVEDELIVAEDLRLTLEGEGYVVTGTFDTAEAAYEHILRESPDLVMVDIRLQGPMTGIDLTGKLRLLRPIPVIYLTANSDEETYQQARRTKPQAFLVKPFNVRTLLAAVDLAFYNFSENREAEGILDPVPFESKPIALPVSDGFFIRTGGKHKKIRGEELLFIEADGSYAKVVTENGQYMISQNLSAFQRKSNLPTLLRVHRSYLVNVNHVDSFDETFLYIGKHHIPISKSYRADFLSVLNAL
ncbi:MAG: response regulator [Cyclobacteriaceae bacterium]|nr:response regulator [Cyclobacteriaceae bacterium]